MANRRLLILALVSGCAWMASAGCREELEPPRSFNKNLGEGDMVLLPGPVPLTNPRIAEGSAEWVEFRDPSAAEAEPAAGEPASGQDAGVRAMVNEFNAFIDAGKYEELPQFFIEAQEEPVRKLLDAITASAEKLKELTATLEEQAPEESKDVVVFLTQSLDQLKTQMKLQFSSFAVKSETEIIGAAVLPAGAPMLPGFKPETRFVLIEGDWYMDDPNIALIESTLLPAVQMQLQMYDGWLQGLKSGSMTPEMVLQTLRPQMEAAKALQGAAEGAAEGAGEEEVANAEEIKAAIRDMVAQFNEALEEGDEEEILSYYVASQRDAARKMMALDQKAEEELEALGDAMEAKSPGSKERLFKIVLGDKRVDLKSIKVLSESEAQGRMNIYSFMPHTLVDFKLEEDRWRLGCGALDNVDAFIANIEEDFGYDEWIEKINSGETTPEEVLTELKAMHDAARALIEAFGTGD